MSAKVWAVYAGGYDERVVAVFKSKRLAEEAATRLAADADGWYSDVRVDWLTLHGEVGEKVRVHSTQVTAYDDGREVRTDHTRLEWPFDRVDIPVGGIETQVVRAPALNDFGCYVRVKSTDATALESRLAELMREVRTNRDLTGRAGL